MDNNEDEDKDKDKNVEKDKDKDDEKYKKDKDKFTSWEGWGQGGWERLGRGRSQLSSVARRQAGDGRNYDHTMTINNKRWRQQQQQ